MIEHVLTHEFNELAQEFSLIGPDGVVCSVEDEDHHENETEEEAHTNSTYCNAIYDFVSLLLVRLNLTTDCCLENGTMCDGGTKAPGNKTNLRQGILLLSP